VSFEGAERWLAGCSIEVENSWDVLGAVDSRWKRPLRAPAGTREHGRSPPFKTRRPES
jgi:hypothetical protein